MVCNCFCIDFFEINGRFGINVNKNNNDGGMAMMKLYEIADALSDSPFALNCFKKKRSTSYKGTPSKPGRINVLDLFTMIDSGVFVNNMRSIFFNSIWLFFLKSTRLMLFDKRVQIPDVADNCLRNLNIL